MPDTTQELSGVQFPAPETGKCPYGYYSALRDTSPVHTAPAGDVVLSRHEDIIWARRNPDLFTSKREFPADNDPELSSLMAQSCPVVPTLVDNDPPEHSAIRRVVNRAFTRPRMKAYEPRVRKLVRDLIDALPTDGPVDFIADFADHLPALVILDVLGMSTDHRHDVMRWSIAWGQLASGTYASHEQALELVASVSEFHDYIAAAAEERMHAPREDVLSELVVAYQDGGMTWEELINVGRTIVFAATANTTNLLGNTMFLVTGDPRIEAAARNPETLDRTIEESMRFETPAQWSQRWATEDIELHGVTIPKGNRVLLVDGAGNRDASRFPDADTFLVDRELPNGHTALGHGIHTCVGAPLARLEARLTFEEFFSRFSRISRTEHEPTWMAHPIQRGLETLELDLTPR